MKEKLYMYRLCIAGLLVLILVTQCAWQNDTIAAVRAVGNQCSAYTIDIEELKVPEVENIN